MTVKELYEALGELLKEHGDEPVYADIIPGVDPMPPIMIVYALDGYVCVGD